ncbi:hypothetical protein BH10BDE1_BH10BDE1_31680 [soil metagenome]
MKREQARAIGLFFLLGLMEERVALSAAARAIAQLKADFSEISRKDREQNLVPTDAIIKACHESWKVHRKQIPRNQPSVPPETAWKVPANIDLGTWARYQRDAPDEDVMTLLFSLVLGITDDELSEGFQTSVGTIRYRLGKAVRQLGLVARPRKSDEKSVEKSGGRG